MCWFFSFVVYSTMSTLLVLSMSPTQVQHEMQKMFSEIITMIANILSDVIQVILNGIQTLLNVGHTLTNLFDEMITCLEPNSRKFNNSRKSERCKSCHAQPEQTLINGECDVCVQENKNNINTMKC